MGLLDPTLVATSQPLDLCQGFALDPLLGNLKAGSTSSGSTVEGGSDLNATFSYTNVLGVCGPAYDYQATISGDNTSGSASLFFSNVAAQAGLIWGASASFGLEVKLDITDAKGDWTFNFSFDIFSLLISLILKVLDEKKGTTFKQVAETLPLVGTSWGFFDASDGSSVVIDQLGYSVNVNPVLSIPINVLVLVPDLDEVLEEASDLGVSIGTGPVLGIAFPTQIGVQTLWWDSRKVTDIVAVPNVVGTATDDSSQDPNNLTVQLAHQTGVTAALGSYVGACFQDLYSISYQEMQQLPTIINNAAAGTNLLSNAKGASLVSQVFILDPSA
jgi:hypothetical protein